MEIENTERIQKTTNAQLPFAPSFIDRFMRSIERLPVPFWLTYLILFNLQSVINHVVSWVDGWVPAWSFNAILFLFPLWQWGTLAIMTYLNTVAEASLASFRPLLNLDDEAVGKIKFEFTTMPNYGVLLIGIVWSIVYVLLSYLAYKLFYVQYGLGIPMQAFIFLEGLICFATGGAIYYHSLRQLFLVHRTLKMTRTIDLFHLEPVYAFSRLTSQTGVSWIIMFVLTLIIFPLRLVSQIVVIIWGIQLVLAVAAFVLPLRSVNHSLVVEKRRLLAEQQQRVESTLAHLHTHIDQNELSEVGQLNNALAGLNTERTILEKIPTWPWRTETLTGFLSAIGLPIILFLIQNILRKWLGG